MCFMLPCGGYDILVEVEAFNAGMLKVYFLTVTSFWQKVNDCPQISVPVSISAPGTLLTVCTSLNQSVSSTCLT